MSQNKLKEVLIIQANCELADPCSPVRAPTASAQYMERKESSDKEPQLWSDRMAMNVYRKIHQSPNTKEHRLVVWLSMSCCLKQFAGRGSSVGYASAWYADGRGFDHASRPWRSAME